MVTEEPESVNIPIAEPAPEKAWVPSYSVSRQGSRSSLVAKEESVAAVADPTPEKTWVPSYSVSRQGSRSSLVVKDEPAPAAIEVPDVQVPEAPATVIVTPDVESEPVVEIKEEAPAVVEAPVRPWTPSYSVSRQGSRSSLVVKEEPAPVTEQTPEEVPGVTATVIVTPDTDGEPTMEAKEAAPATVEVPERPWTPSYSVSHQGSSPVPSPKIETSELPVSEETAPERPWTPSYSVSRQGSSPLLESKELASTTDEVSIPTVQAPEITEEVPVIAVNTVDVVVEAAPTVSIPEVRTWCWCPVCWYLIGSQ